MSSLDLQVGQFPKGRVIHGRAVHIHLPVSERIYTARKLPQAVVKVTSFGKGVKGVSKQLDYISRKGELPLEKDDGEVIKGREAQKELVGDWSMDFGGRKNSRDTAHIVFSMPPGSNQEALRKAVHATGAKAFPNHEWVFAIHEDRKHPHAHMIVKMRGIEEDKKLQLKKADLYKLRETFAESAREQGVPLAASSRAARGVGHKGVRQAIYQMRHKGIQPEVDKQAKQELDRDLARGNRTFGQWEKSMLIRNELEKEAYRRDAEVLRLSAKYESKPMKHDEFLKDAQDLEDFAKTLPKPWTRRQRWHLAAWRIKEEQQRENDRDQGMER